MFLVEGQGRKEEASARVEHFAIRKEEKEVKNHMEEEK